MKQLLMFTKAIKWLRERRLPVVGFVFFHDGQPFAWDRERLDPSRVVPGVIALRLCDRVRFVATGGTADRGSLRFDVAKGKPAAAGNLQP